MGKERKKLFLIDDTEFSLVRTKQFLKDYYEVYTIDSATKMFELLEKVWPDLILLDIEMPGMDGYETLELLKNKKHYSQIPVIFLSGRYDEKSILKGLTLGAVDHVIKPYTPKDLLERIASDREMGISREEIEKLLNVQQFTGCAEEQTTEFLKDVTAVLNANRKLIGIDITISV